MKLMNETKLQRWFLLAKAGENEAQEEDFLMNFYEVRISHFCFRMFFENLWKK